jgi:threonylcarbamoyladenosine tRNA methylthiotransferase MtaB
MRISLLTLGCRVNQSETISIEKDLLERGHEIVSLGERPDICIINTCTVTSKSDYQSRQLIRRAHKAGARTLVTGCYAELNKGLVGDMDGVEEVIGNHNKSNIISMIEPSSESLTLIKEVSKGSRTRKFLKVQDGCNYSCSYCIVTKARGPSRSISPESVIECVNEAVSEGFNEVILNGVHLGLYGQDLRSEWSIAGLVENILEKTGVSRIRLGSLEINEIEERLMDLMSEPRICRHLHIPLQSGDDRVLGDMRRNYDSIMYRNRIESILNTSDGMTIGTDIIAGFPTETEDSFNNTLKLAGEIDFAYMHIFPYSRRPGTAAAEMTDMVGDERRKEMASALRELSKRKKMDYMKMHIGKTLDVLIEERDQDGSWRGTSSNYLKVRISGNAQSRGSIVPVRIQGIQDDQLVGNAFQKE